MALVWAYSWDTASLGLTPYITANRKYLGKKLHLNQTWVDYSFILCFLNYVVYKHLSNVDIAVGIISKPEMTKAHKT